MADAVAVMRSKRRMVAAIAVLAVVTTGCSAAQADSADPRPVVEYDDGAPAEFVAWPAVPPAPPGVTLEAAGSEVAGVLYTADWVVPGGEDTVVEPLVPVPWPHTPAVMDGPVRIQFDAPHPPDEVEARLYAPPLAENGEPVGEPEAVIRCAAKSQGSCEMGADGAWLLTEAIDEPLHLVVFAAWNGRGPEQGSLPTVVSASWLFRLAPR